MAVERYPNAGVLRTIRFEKQTDSNGVLSADIQIPGSSGVVERVIGQGVGWFENKANGDFAKVSVVDKDGIIYEAGTVVERFFDNSVSEDLQGSFIPFHSGEIVIGPLTGFTALIGGLYLRIEAEKGDGTQDTFRGNLQLSERP